MLRRPSCSAAISGTPQRWQSRRRILVQRWGALPPASLRRQSMLASGGVLKAAAAWRAGRLQGRQGMLSTLGCQLACSGPRCR